MPNRRYNTQVAPQFKAGGRVKRMGGGMSTARRDMRSGYYKNDMGMKGGKMYKEGGKVGKKKKSKKEHPMKEERFQQTRQADIAKAIGKENVGDPRVGRGSKAYNENIMAKGGRVGKKKHGYKDRKEESNAMRIRKKRTAKQLKASRDDSYGRFGSNAKKPGKRNRQ